jgi:hypothetical protein
MYTSKDMERGTELEPTARLMYMLRTKNIVEETEFVKHPVLLTGASTDGLLTDYVLLITVVRAFADLDCYIESLGPQD